MKKLLLLSALLFVVGISSTYAREVKKLGTKISFEDALTTTEPFVIVQDGMVLCGPLTPSDGSLTYHAPAEIDDYAYSFVFEEDADHPGSYYMHLYNQESTPESKGYMNASVWSHTWLSGVDKTTTKGELQDGALWTIALVGEKQYTIRNLGVAEGNYNNKPGGSEGDRAAQGQGYLGLTKDGYWANHVTHYNTSGIWEFYLLDTEVYPDVDPLYFGWDDLTFDGDAKVTSDSEIKFVRDARDWAPYWTETAKWELSTPFDATGYKYLVFYPKRNVVRFGNGDNDTGGTVFIRDANGTSFRGDDYFKYNDNNYPDHTGKMWMNIWNEQRIAVIDLEWLANSDKYGNGSECKVLDITQIKAFGFSGDFTIGGAFFTTVLPLTSGDYKRDFTNEQTPVYENFGTICLPYSAVCCGAQLYEIVGKTSNSITIAEYEGVMEAGKAYMYKTLEAKQQYWGVVRPETSVYFFKAGFATETNPVASNGFVGTFTDTTAPIGSNYYVLSNNKLYQVNSNVTVGANKAYIDVDQITNSSSAKARVNLFFDGADETTGIENLDAIETLTSGKVYDLSGRVVTAPTKGLYIVNGKKVFVK